MKKILTSFCALLLCAQVGFAKDVEHKVGAPAVAQAAKQDAKLGYTRAKFTMCNKTSTPLFFIGWAIDTWETKPYRWNDWLLANECRTDKFDKFFNISLYEVTYGPGEPLLFDFVLREGKTLNITETYLAQHAK